jgi:excisionase family DNA binding protein
MPRGGAGRTPLPRRSKDAHPLMTIHAAAQALGCSDMTIRRRIEARQFPAVKIGNKALVPRTFVERLLADALAGQTVVVEEYAAEWGRAHGAVATGGGDRGGVA